MNKEVFFLTHVFVRFLADFGNVLRFVDRQGYAVTMLTSPPVETDQFSTYRREMVEHYRNMLPKSVKADHLPYRLGNITPWSVARMFALAFRLGWQHPDALFVLWGAAVNIACGLPLRLLNRKCLFMVTGLGTVLGSKDPRFVDDVRLARKILLSAYSYLLSGPNSRCLTHNADDKQFLASTLEIEPANFFVTPGCGVDPKVFPFFETLPDNPRKIIIVPARLIEEKGILDAAEASRLLREQGVDHEMWFTGVVEPYPKYLILRREGCTALSKENIERLQKENPCVRFIGYQRSLVALYEKCDIVCLPSRYPEGVPTVLIEAAACGRPAVTCDNVGCREIVLHEETGLVVPKADPTALAGALQRMISERDLCERFRCNAYQHFLKNYTKDIALQRTVEAFESLQFPFSGEHIAPDIRAAETAS